MDEQEKKEWQYQNGKLQHAYHIYQHAINCTQKNDALRQIQVVLMWPPFSNYINEQKGYSPDGILRYGLDYITERCIGEIDIIANK